MSKERRRRREQREAAGPTAPTRAPRTGRPSRPTRPVRPTRRRARGGALTRHRRQQDVLLALVLLAGNGLLWTQVHSWPLRVVALVVTAALWPVIVTVAFDRRSS